MKYFERVKEEKGSVTLFVLASMLFFVIVLVGLYVSSSYKVQKQDKEITKIQKSYKHENINDIYNLCEENYKNRANESDEEI